MIWFDIDKLIDEIIVGFKYLKLVSSFCSKYVYNNLMFVIVGEVVVCVFGMSWNDYIEKNIFELFDMKNLCVGFLCIFSSNKNWVMGYILMDG